MVMEFKCGQMGLGMKVFGNITKPVAKESSGMSMGMSSKDNGKKTRQMAMAFMST